MSSEQPTACLAPRSGLLSVSTGLSDPVLIEHARRFVDSGALVPAADEALVMTFEQLKVGTRFRMIAGRWPLIKLSEYTAARLDGSEPTLTLELAHEFEGSERCVVIEGE